MEQPLEPMSLGDELRLHSRYIRDTLVPLLSRRSKLSLSDTILIHSIFKKLESTPMTLELLRYSRMEKALMVIVATGASCWPMDVVVLAEEMLQKWEDQLGPLKNLRADLYGPDGKLMGLKRIITSKHRKEDRDDDAKSAWSVEGDVDPSRAHRFGHLGFEVGHWWLKPAAAFRDGIIDDTSHAITADERAAYAIVLTHSQAQDLNTEGKVRFHAAPNDPGAFKLMKTMVNDTEKVVRVLRSYKLRSSLAPKAGLRYDGLYQIASCGVKLNPPNSWHITCLLARIEDQPPVQQALCVPMADQLDDWKDYQRLKSIDRGEDFAILRELVSGPITSFPEAKKTDSDQRDSGYFSRRSPQTNRKVVKTPGMEGEEVFLGHMNSKSGRRYEDLVPEIEEDEDDDENGRYFNHQSPRFEDRMIVAPSLSEEAGHVSRRVFDARGKAEIEGTSDVQSTLAAEDISTANYDEVSEPDLGPNTTTPRIIGSAEPGKSAATIGLPMSLLTLHPKKQGITSVGGEEGGAVGHC